MPLHVVVVALISAALLGCAGAELRSSDAPPPLRSWAPCEAPRAIIIALHGFNDYRRAFEMFGPWAADHGILVDAYDQQGFGETDNRGYWAGHERLATDLYERIAIRRQQYPSVPMFVLGESMGAAVAIVAVTDKDAPHVDGLVLVSPAVWGGDSINPIYRMVLWSMVQVAPGWQLTGRQLKIQASDNIEMLRELGRDPLVIKATRVDAIAGLVELMDVARERTVALNMPLLVLSGARDQVVDPKIQQGFVAELDSERCIEVTYPNGWHLLLRDHQSELVWRDILTWIETSQVETPVFTDCGSKPAPVG